MACAQPVGYVEDGTDCNDASDAQSPEDAARKAIEDGLKRLLKLEGSSG